mgnify:FL=1
MIIDQLILELITVIHSIGVCLCLVVYNVSINVNLDEHVQWLDNSGHYKYPAISQPGSS